MNIICNPHLKYEVRYAHLDGEPSRPSSTNVARIRDFAEIELEIRYIAPYNKIVDTIDPTQKGRTT